MSHSALGGSNAYIWTVCTAQPSMVAGIPDPSGYPAALGTVAHQLGELCLHQNKQAQELIGVEFYEEVEGEQQRFVVDQDMVDAVQIYLDHIRGIAPGAQWHIESRVDLSRLHRGMYGTADFWTVVGNMLIVRDYKHGEWNGVEITGPQLPFYAIGAFFKALDAGYTITHVDIGIVQPRYAHEHGPIRTMVMTVDQLNEWANFFASKARETEENPQLMAGPHCKYCVAKHCRARALMLIDLNTLTHQLGEMTDEECERWLAHRDMIRKGFEAIDHVIQERMKTGRLTSKEWKLIRSSPRATCTDPKLMYDALPFWGLDPVQFQKAGPPPPVSRTEAKKIAGDKFDYVDQFYHTPEPGVKLVPITARGQAITPKNANSALQSAFTGFQLPNETNGGQHG